ncbi:MAG: hypothetical protein IPK74_07930 [Deltaproteobacteria bacterium]|nr:hypothetical protein [Deltaproteobacteria bacterium]
MANLKRRSDLLDVEVERAVWSRGGRPLGGMVLRLGVGATFLLLALLIPEPVTRIVFAIAGLIVLVFLGPIMDRRLGTIAEAIDRVDRGRANTWLGSLEKLRVVQMFAPHAWVALQKGRLHLVVGNGRAAAKSLSDCARISGATGHAALISGQAHGLLLAGDRKEARELLQELEKQQKLGARDHLDLGIALLEDVGRTAVAKQHLDLAREQLGGHPRVLAALALALARGDDTTAALELLDAAQAHDDLEDDELARELLKRARKALRPALDAAEKRARKAKQATEIAARPAAAAPSRTEAKKDRKDRRKERREKRQRGKSDAAKPSDAAAQRREDEAAAKRREDEAAAKRREDEAAAKRREDEAAAKRREDEAAAKRREDEAAAKRREEEAAAAKRREDEAAAKRREEEAAAAKRREDEAAALRREAEAEARRVSERAAAEAKRLADEAAAEAKRLADEAAAERIAAAAKPEPTFLPPPMPTAAASRAPAVAAPVIAAPVIAAPVIAAPVVAVPPVIAAPVVAAPSVVAAASVRAVEAPAVDASGWDELLGDAGDDAKP